MKFKRVGVLLLVLALMVAVLGGCGKKAAEPPQDNAAQKEKFKVGFIYVGVPGDAGWTYAHDQARLYLQKEMPDVETVYLEKVSEGADAERSIEQLAQQGCKLIFTTSFGFGDGTLAVAKKYPDIKFMHCSGVQTAANVGTYFGREYQARYLTGMIAGKMTKTNKVGYVAAFGIPEVVRGIDAFTLGVRSVNPNATVKVAWTSTWGDPVKEKQAAQTVLSEGCDVVTQHQDTPAVQQAAEEAGKYCIGYNSDMRKFAPNTNLTSPVWDWGPYYVKTVKSVMDGTWKSGSYWGGMSDGVIGLAPISDQVPADVKQLVDDKKAEIISGQWDVFTGPIKGQDGSLKVKEGEKLTDAQMLSLDWFVEGVEGSIK